MDLQPGGCLSVCLSVRLSVCPSVRLSVRLFLRYPHNRLTVDFELLRLSRS